MRLFSDPWNTAFHEVHQERRTMRTDIREKDGNLILAIELPGWLKEDIQIDCKNGYLNVCATRQSQQEITGRMLRKERYSEDCSRSFYIGEALQAEDIKASFGNGELLITLPKEAPKKVEQKTFIPIQ